MNLKLGGLGSYLATYILLQTVDVIFTFLRSIKNSYFIGTEDCDVHWKLHQCWFLTPIF